VDIERVIRSYIIGTVNLLIFLGLDIVEEQPYEKWLSFRDTQTSITTFSHVVFFDVLLLLSMKIHDASLKYGCVLRKSCSSTPTPYRPRD
jgi:hypothetical protein